ncbi:unnamed protein product [Orchesella dallaii]|uniref:Uncharacterized protein n=1 Tax=Orchesella dallaii TaxID=48710 RepID=A0ABP1QFV1_9HEXA
MRRVSSILVTLALALTLSEQNSEEFCKDRKHYNDLEFTCCANKKYDSPKIYSSGKDAAMTTCLAMDEVMKATKLVTKSWLLYKCLVKGKTNGEITLDSFVNFMVQRYPPNIQTSIKNTATEVQKLIIDKKKARRKRSTRTKRDADSEESSTTEDPEGAKGTSGEETSTTPEGVPANSDADTMGKDSTTEVDGDGDTKVETSPNPLSPDTNAEDLKEEDNNNNANTINTDPPTTSTTTVTPKPFHLYLSSFDYYNQFKDNLPDEDLFIIWDAYYVAEFQICQSEAGSSKDYLMEYLTKRCLSWTQQTIRAGDCCGATPVPLPLIQDPAIPLEYVQNFTAEQIMSITGTYTWNNLSFSSNIYRCNRLSVSVLQKKVSLDEIRKEIQDFASENETTITAPNYEGIAKRLVPPFYPADIQNRLIKEILPPTTTSRPGVKPEKTGYFDSILYDTDIQTISNFEYPVYQWAVASEWDSLDENQTRYLMWMCDAYRMVSQRIKFFDETPFC